MTEETLPTESERRYDLRIALPGDWVAIDTGAVSRYRREREDLSPQVEAAARLVEAAAEAFRTQATVFSAILAEQGSMRGLATLACFVVGFPRLPDDVDLVDHLRASAPHDAIAGSFVVDEDAGAGGKLRARCLRRSVLEVPTRDSVSLSVEYFLPILQGGMFVAAFATPNAAEEDDYLGLFSKVASTIEIAA